MLLILTYRIEHVNHEGITLIIVAYVMVIFFNMILLNLHNIEQFYQSFKFILPIMNVIINIICLIFNDLDEDGFTSIMAIFIIMHSIIFQSEYIETFIHYTGLCVTLCILFFIE